MHTRAHTHSCAYLHTIHLQAHARTHTYKHTNMRIQYTPLTTTLTGGNARNTSSGAKRGDTSGLDETSKSSYAPIT